MDPKVRSKVRAAVKKIKEDMKSDPDLRQRVDENHVRVLVEHGKLNFKEVVAADDIKWCPGATQTCSDVKQSLQN
jgi:hypothetical protein